MSRSIYQYHFDNLKADKKATEYYNEIKQIRPICDVKRHISQNFSKIWSIKKCAEYFFDEMDYFDNNEEILNKHAIIFCKRLELICMVSWSNIDMIQLDNLYFDGNKPIYITLWKKMLLEVNKTTLWIQNRYSVYSGNGGYIDINLQYNIHDFNEGYLSNILNLARKQLEIFVEHKKIEFQIALNNYEQQLLSNKLTIENDRLEKQLNEHILQYKKMSLAFDESQKANKALQDKVNAQDKLIENLNSKMDKIISLFAWFKEEAPKQMLTGIIGNNFMQIENISHNAT